MNTYGSSWIFADPSDNISTPGYTVHTIPVVEQGCDCGLTPKCTKEFFGIKYGCYVTEAFSQLPMACLYDAKCVDKSGNNNSLSNPGNSSRFSINTTYEALLSELMVENLIHDLDYEIYFSKCKPSLCIYKKSNFKEGIIELISLYGGVAIICRLIAVILVKLIRRRSVEITPVTD
ncbi:unnamed protein product [Adineta steineri]|uniref:Uncharacterized protein n=1 Tax=Adineta steineri TaxID=433720 RepID=A0A815EPP1_9BILA|nr:unnamed protein product [Adineta steineri]CAF1582204.1 unnamed protein product [Adineta steineri]